MEVDEIYSQLSIHMIQGIMFHDQMANYYDFLGLKGYKRCHEYHMFKEMTSYRALNRYFINHHNILIPEEAFDNPEIIPESWFNYSRQDVDASTKKSAVKAGLDKWVSWERETKHLYEKMYKELCEIGEVASAMQVKEFICDVDAELKKAERYKLNKEATGYDLVSIIEEQPRKHHKYQKKLESIGISIC